MQNVKFKLVNSITKQAFGFEYLTIDGWKNNVFDYGERDGSFDQRELGDGFLGIVQRFQFVFTDKNGKDIFEGDKVEYKYLPPPSECDTFFLVPE